MQSLKPSQLLLVAFLSVVFMSGCQKQSLTDKEKVTDTAKPTQSNPVTPQENTSSKVASQPSSQEQANIATAEKIDVTQAIDINRDADFSVLKYILIAQNPKPMTDEEKLKLVSREYAKEIDGFKKKDLAAQLLPKINAEVEKYKGQPVVKIPIVSLDMGTKYWETLNKQRGSEINPIYLGYGEPGPYDFNTHAFPLYCSVTNNFVGQLYKSGFGKYAGIPSINLGSTGAFAMPKDKCELVVTDETIARKMEAARKVPQGALYAHFTVESDRLILNPMYAKIDYLNLDTGEVLATKELHW